MFKPARFKKFSVIIHLRDLERVISAINSIPLAEIRSLDFQERELEGVSADEKSKQLSFNASKARRTLNILSQHAEKKGLKEQAGEFLFPDKAEKIKVETGKAEKLAEKLEPTVQAAEKIEKQLKELKEEKTALEEELGILKSLKKLGAKIDLLHGFETMEIIIGVAPEELSEAVEREFKENNAALLGRFEAAQVLFAASIEKNKAEELLRSLRKTGFERIEVPEKKGDAEQLISECRQRIEEIEAEEKKLKKKSGELFKKNERMLLAALEALEIEKNRLDAMNFFGKSGSAANFDVFVPAKKEKEFMELLKKETNNSYYAEGMSFNEEEVPIKLEHKGFAKPYEMIVKMYGMPEYNSFDPTLFIAIAFPVFFGLAFSDAGYGLMLLALSIFMIKTVAKKSEDYNALAKILLHGSIATIAFGIAFGSFFGDLLGDGLKKYALMDPLGTMPNGESATLILMIIIIGIALIHLNLGLLVGVFEGIKRKKYKMVLTEKMPFILIQFGLLFLLLNFSSLAGQAGLALIITSLLLLFIGGGPLGLMKITGFLGNVLSYLRLMALGLATFAIAMAINVLAGMLLPIPVIGFIAMIAFLVIAHTANFVFNIISSFVHPLRLHCVEFFSYFFEGSGKQFKPFYSERKYTSEVKK